MRYRVLRATVRAGISAKSSVVAGVDAKLQSITVVPWEPTRFVHLAVAPSAKQGEKGEGQHEDANGGRGGFSLVECPIPYLMASLAVRSHQRTREHRVIFGDVTLSRGGRGLGLGNDCTAVLSHTLLHGLSRRGSRRRFLLSFRSLFSVLRSASAAESVYFHDLDRSHATCNHRPTPEFAWTRGTAY